MALREISGYVCFLSTTAPSPNLFMSPRLSLIISVCFPPFVSCCSLSLSLSLFTHRQMIAHFFPVYRMIHRWCNPCYFVECPFCLCLFFSRPLFLPFLFFSCSIDRAISPLAAIWWTLIWWWTEYTTLQCCQHHLDCVWDVIVYISVVVWMCV